MGFFEKMFKEKRVSPSDERYIDLGEWVEKERIETPGKMMVKVAEIYKYEDLSALTTQIYNGHMVILDYSPIASDEYALRRITSELKQLSSDINGDLAGIGKHMLIITPSGVKVDREKIRGTY